MDKIVGRRIVIVGGSERWRNSCFDILTGNGFDVAAFARSRQALEHLKNAPADLVLAEFVEVKSAKTQWKDFLGKKGKSRVVLLSGSTQYSVIVECFKLGADDCILKPRGMEELARAVGEALGTALG